MVYVLSEEQSIAYLLGRWDAHAVEEYVAVDLIRQDVAEPVVVMLCDYSAVAFYVAAGGEIL